MVALCAMRCGVRLAREQRRLSQLLLNPRAPCRPLGRRPPGDRGRARAQLGKAYPPAGATAAVVELDRYDERQLLAPEGGAFPLIVRMETVTEKGLADGHTLQVREKASSNSCCPSVWSIGVG